MELKAENLAEGRYPQRLEARVNSAGMAVNGMEIERIDYSIQFTYIKETIYPKVIGRFDVEGRGKYLEIEYDDPDRGLLRIVIAAGNEQGKRLLHVS